MKYIFDVDGTLTPSRTKMNKHFAIWFSKFCNKNEVYLVTGSDVSKTIEQVGEYIHCSCKSVYQCSGNEVYIKGTLCYTTSWELPNDARDFLENELKESVYPYRTGNHIEERAGMVNFSVVGRNCNKQERTSYVNYDKATNERKTIADRFNAKFPDITANVAGETGLDIGELGSDKSQILRNFDKLDEIYFFGDSMFKGGNDYALAEALKDYPNAKSFEVSSWKDTLMKLKELTDD